MPLFFSVCCFSIVSPQVIMEKLSRQVPIEFDRIFSRFPNGKNGPAVFLSSSWWWLAGEGGGQQKAKKRDGDSVRAAPGVDGGEGRE